MSSIETEQLINGGIEPSLGHETDLPYAQFLCRPEEVELTPGQQAAVEDWYRADTEPLPGRGPKRIDREAYMASVKRWLTGNYDPDTGLHTFYRFVGQPAVDSFARTGALTTRAVQNFGGGSDFLAIERLNRIVGDTTTEDDESLIDSLLASRRRSEFTDGYKDYTQEEIRDGVKLQADIAYKDISAALSSNPDDYFARVKDQLLYSASPRKGTIFELFQSMIHTTTEPVEITVASGHEYRLTIHARPGAFMPGGTFVGDEFVGHWPTGEWEWSGFGAFYPTGNESIEVEKIR